MATVGNSYQLTSAAGVLSLLDETDPELQIFALDRLDKLVDEFWPEISEVVSKLEILYEDFKFSHRHNAALLVSKVYYHLGSFDDSLAFALGAGQIFSATIGTEYFDTIIAQAIDQYIKLRNENLNSPAPKPIDPRLESIVNAQFQRCIDHGEFKQAIGIAIETRRMDIFEEAVLKSPDQNATLEYAYKVTLNLINNLGFRNQVLTSLTKLYKNLKTPDLINMVQCLIYLDDHLTIAELLKNLVKMDNDQTLQAYQISFDLYDSATQLFLSKIIGQLAESAPIPNLVFPKKATQASAAAAAAAEPEAPAESMDVDEAADASGNVSVVKVEVLDDEEQKLQDHFTNLAKILCGDITVDNDLQFLIRKNRTDLLILKNTKEAVRHSICHNATVIANSFMHCGTTSDQFLRDNLDWLGRAVNWAKFSATASLGVIHKRHEKEALHLMSSYLPKDSGPGSGYTEGGGLYALGLIHANHGGAIVDYLIQQLGNASNEAVKHGGCLGLGLAAMGTQDMQICDRLKALLYEDDAIIGEAAGLGMGLVMLGSGNEAVIKEMISYAQETQHEKILRGLAIGISMIVYQRLEDADSLIEKIIKDKDNLMRRCAMHCIAMAYCGTGSNYAIRQLLHVAVSDVSDDVRRSAVEAIGFVLFRNPDQCPSVVSLLSESYNPHVRYGAAMALGISCASTGNKEALALLEPMTNDATAFVRQGALVASAMILVQQTEHTCPKSKDFRALYSKVISDKHDDLMAKFGAILAQGIIDAGGRNVAISLQSRTGHTSLESVVGMLVFTQFWYWYPFSHFLSLTFRPTSLIGLNIKLEMPKMDFKSNCKPSAFGYPSATEEKREKERGKVSTAILSITSKAKRREIEKKKEEKMDVDAPADKKTDDVAKSPKKEGEPKKEKEVEPNFEILQNPARVMPAQLKHITMVQDARYKPAKELSVGGIIMMRDLKPADPIEIVEPVKAGGPKIEEEKEPEPPEPFEYVE